MSLEIGGRTLRGIDVHTHIPRRGGMAADPRAEQKQRYFKSPTMGMTVEQMVELYRKLEMVAVVFDIDKETTSDDPFEGNDYVAEVMQRYPDVFIGWASVDPWKGRAAVKELERAVTQLGLRGLKLHPITQAFFPNDERFYPIYAKAQELGIPVIFHTGHTGIGAGTPGGTGIKLKYSRPIPYIDDIAADFPNLTIIGAHPSWPWQEESLAIARHKSNFYIDLSGWAPKYFPQELIQYTNSIIQDRVLFGTDWPVIGVERYLSEFDEIAWKPAVRQKLMLDNAKKLLGL